MRVGDEELVHPVVILGAGRLLAPATTALRPVLGQRLRLDVARVGQRHHHVLRRDQVLDVDLAGVELDLRAARILLGAAELFHHPRQLVADDGRDARRLGQDVQQVQDAVHHLAVLGDDLLLLQPGQPLQAHLQDLACLHLGQLIGAVGLKPRVRIDAFRSQRRHVARRALDHLGRNARRPGPRQQPFLGHRRRGRGLDQLDHLVDVDHRHRQTFQQVPPVTRLVQLVDRAPRHHLAPVRQEGFQHLLQVQQPGLAVDQRHHVDAEAVLQLRELEQVVEHHLGVLAAFQLDHHPHALLVGLIADVGDALDLLLVDQLGDLLLQHRLVHLVRDLVDDDRLAVARLVHVLEVRLGAHHHPAAAGAVALAHARHPIDQRAGGEVGGRNLLDQLVDRRIRILQQQQAGGHHLVQVVRRNVGGHGHRDARAAVDEQVGDLGRQHLGLGGRTVVVRPEVHRVLLDVDHHLAGDLAQPDLGVTHRRRRVAVHRAEVALAVHQRVAQREVLRHPHDRVVDGRVAVRVILTHHVAHHAGRLEVGSVPDVVQLVHGVEHPAVHRLEAVAHIGQRAPHDHAHGVIEEGTLHFLLETDRYRFFGELILIHGIRDAPHGPRAKGPAARKQETRAQARVRKKGGSPDNGAAPEQALRSARPQDPKKLRRPPTTGLEDPSMTGPCLAPAKPLNFRPSAPPTHGQPETGSHVSARTRHPSHFCPFTRLAPLLPLRRILGPHRVPKPASRHEYVANERQFTPRASQNGPKSLRTDRTLWHNESSVFVWTQPYGHGPKVVLYASSLHFAQGHSW